MTTWRTIKHLVLLVPFLLLIGCADNPASPDAPEEETFLPQSAVRGVTLDRQVPAAQTLRTMYVGGARREMGGGIVHYQFDVQLGSGPYDVVRLHRVVRERRRYRPIRTRGAVFMLHGASLNFEAIFLNAGMEAPDAETSAALYLAANGVDVWGMDFAWTQVPGEATDFSFMQGWGVERDAEHTLAAMSIARFIRGLTRQGFGPMHLLGYSYGVGVAYAAAGRETQQPPAHRDIKGLIPVDQALKFAAEDEASRQTACIDAAAIHGLISAGIYQNGQGAGLGGFSQLASGDPEGASPIIPGLTNHQAALLIGTSTFALGPPLAPFWHFIAGTFDENNLPDGLLYSDPARWIRLLGTLPPYMPEQARYDIRVAQCNEADVSIDDHLAQIDVPILYIGAGGGFGEIGDYTGGLTASSDVTNYTVSVQPPEARAIDYGHADLFLGDDAAERVWEVLRGWLVDHRGRSRLSTEAGDRSLIGPDGPPTHRTPEADRPVHDEPGRSTLERAAF